MVLVLLEHLSMQTVDECNTDAMEVPGSLQ